MYSLSFRFQVTDVNDNSPVFNDTLYRFTIPEGCEKRPLGHVKASDLDTGRNARLSYFPANSEEWVGVLICIDNRFEPNFL